MEGRPTPYVTTPMGRRDFFVPGQGNGVPEVGTIAFFSPGEFFCRRHSRDGTSVWRDEGVKAPLADVS